jgi:predicted transcriptional regulator
MSKLSQEKIKKIKEEILSLLYNNNLKPMFTNEVAEHLIRDEEFIKNILLDLKKEGIVTEVSKSQKGQEYRRWRRWALSKKIYGTYNNLSLSINH